MHLLNIVPADSWCLLVSLPIPYVLHVRRKFNVTLPPPPLFQSGKFLSATPSQIWARLTPFIQDKTKAGYLTLSLSKIVDRDRKFEELKECINLTLAWHPKTTSSLAQVQDYIRKKNSQRGVCDPGVCDHGVID